MVRPSDELIGQYVVEVFGDADRAGVWLTSRIPSLGNDTPESLLLSGEIENLRRVLEALVRIDYGVIG